jgi:hypothetical protein
MSMTDRRTLELAVLAIGEPVPAGSRLGWW